MQSPQVPLLVVLTGATAVGKTHMAIEVAKLFDSPIVSADSRQIYREMHIGTASPTPAELAEAEHHMIAIRSIHEPTYNAALYAADALALLGRLFVHHPIVIVCGGSMMYVDALCRGLDPIPSVPVQVRAQLWHEYTCDGIAQLKIELGSKDPDYLARIDSNNYKRILRALEVIRHTGAPFSSFHRQASEQHSFRILHIELSRPRPELFARINARVDMMMASGLEDEARSLYPFRKLNALDTVGYKELFAYFDCRIGRDEAIQLIKRNSRIYARRQQTYWRHRNEVQVIDLSSTDAALDTIYTYVQNVYATSGEFI